MRWITLLTFAGIVGMPVLLYADKPGTPATRVSLVGGGKYVLVVLCNPAFETEQGNAIRKMYPSGGLYRAGDATTPLWTFDWHREKIEVLDDGVHMIRHGDWPSRKGGFKNKVLGKDELAREAVSFFANGKLLREVSIGEVVDDPTKLPLTVSHFRWLKSSQVLIPIRQFEVITLDGNRVRFDLTTGKTLDKRRIEE